MAPLFAPPLCSGLSGRQLTGLLALIGFDAADVRRLLGDENFQEAAQAVLKLSPDLCGERTH